MSKHASEHAIQQARVIEAEIERESCLCVCVLLACMMAHSVAQEVSSCVMIRLRGEVSLEIMKPCTYPIWKDFKRAWGPYILF